MTCAQSLQELFGAEVEDAAEESFLLFSQDIPSQNLGIIDDRASLLDLTVGNKDFVIKQSPAVLKSTREGGTTGAVVWKVTPLVADWLGSPDNVLFAHGILHASATMLELGSGIAGIIPVTLASRVRRVIATDQHYALKLLRDNIEQNLTASTSRASRKSKQQYSSQSKHTVDVLPLDWEADDVQSLLRSNNEPGGVDALFACDCIYNYALIQPFVQTCVDVCRMRAGAEKPTICAIAQQLRQPDVLEEWITAFAKHFRIWRLPDEFLTPDLQAKMGFVVHLGVLREESDA